MKHSFSSPRELAVAMKEMLGEEKLVVRPYNYTKPDDTIWWLIPSTDNPMFKFGKIFFEMKKGKMFCGYHLEKGIGDIEIEDNSSRYDSFKMNKEWIWEDFMKSVSNGDEGLLSIFQKLASNKIRSYCNVEIGVFPFSLKDSKEDLPDNFKEQFDSSEIEFEINSNLNLIYQENKKRVNNRQENVRDFLSELQKETSLVGMLLKIGENKVPDWKWLWIDIYFGVYIEENNNITEGELWREYLGLWDEWLRKSKV